MMVGLAVPLYMGRRQSTILSSRPDTPRLNNPLDMPGEPRGDIMTDIPRFTGFPEEALQFYAKLALNNNREWFNPRKEYFRNTVLAPAQSFVEALGQRLQDELSRDIQFDPRTSGSGSIKRIYRDTRFSKDKTPYKTNLGIHFWQGHRERKFANPGFFFHMGLDGTLLYCGHYEFPRPMLAAYRKVVDDPELGAELETLLAKLRTIPGFDTGGSHYKRVPRGFAGDHPRADLLRYNALWAASPQIDEEVVLTTGLVDTCLEYAKVMLPLNKWLAKVDRMVED